MNYAHLHIIFNHVPQIAFLIGFILLVYGLIRKSNETIQASFIVMVMGMLGGIIAYFTGEQAAELIQKIPRNQLDMLALEAHEEMSGFALIAITVTGLAAIQAFFFIRQNHPKSKQAIYAVLVVSILAVLISARTAYLGGLIRHSEFHF
jgi:uncharacterized membrane protein